MDRTQFKTIFSNIDLYHIEIEIVNVMSAFNMYFFIENSLLKLSLVKLNIF
jgi:hypothetical protein